MTAPDPGPAADRDNSPTRDVRWRRFAWFLVMAVCYLLVGLWLSYDRGIVLGDALSRLADARFVLFSRDPHLAAMGFVFTPLTTFIELPLVAVLDPWPDLLIHGVPGIVMSAVTMSLAVLQIAGMLRDRRMSSPWIIAVSAMVALHPMIIFYAANGMSEAPFLLMMAICVRYLLRWMGSDDVHDLAILGIALALGFLVRYDALAVAIGCGILVAGTTGWRHRQAGQGRASAMAMDLAIIAAPISTAFVLWSAVGWLITGEAFAQFSSQYGNTAILELSGGASYTPTYRALFAAIEWLALEPMIIAVIAIALVWTGMRRVPDALPALVVYGAVLGFQALVFVRGGTFGFLRFAITVIPLAASLVGVLRPRVGILYSRRAGPAATLHGSSRRLSPARRIWSWLAVATLLLPALLVAPRSLASPTTAPQEYATLVSLLPSNAPASTRLEAETAARTFRTEPDVAAYLDSLELPDGSVVTDTLYGYAVVLSSDHPRQFVIPSDHDFVNILNDPVEYEVSYFLTVPNSGRGTTDAVNLRYPTIYQDGADVAVLELEFVNDGSDQPDYRLYRVRRTI